MKDTWRLAVDERDTQSSNDGDETVEPGDVVTFGEIEDHDDDLSSSIVGTLTETPRRHRRTARIGTPAFIPHDIVKRPKLVALATRLKMTPAQQAIYTEALIAEAGGDSTKVSASYSYADKSRRKVGKQIASSFKEQWAVPRFATLHWDSKQMISLSNTNISEERLSFSWNFQ